MNAIGYIRVSTGKQEISPEVQEKAIRAYCEMRGMELGCFYRDIGVSGSVPLHERPMGCAMDGKHNVAIIAMKLDRLFRDAADCLNTTREWDEKGVVLHIVDMGGNSIDTRSAAGRFMLTVLAGAAEMERNLIIERTEQALAHKKERGEKLGGSRPFGWRVVEGNVKVLEPVAEEQEVIERVRQAHEEGMSLRDIADYLTMKGVKTATGNGKWSHTTVARLVNL